MRGTQPKHWYMASVQVSFVIPEDETLQIPAMASQRTINVLITPTRKKIRAQEMDDIRQLALVKMRDVYKVDPQQVSDFVILNIMSLGIMSEKEYFENMDPTKPA